MCFCGHDWKVASDLLENIDKQSKHVADFIDKNASIIEQDLIRFREKYIDEFKSIFELYIENLEFDETQWKRLNSYYLNNGKENITKWQSRLNNLCVHFEDLLSKKLNAPENDLNFNLLISRIKKHQEEIGEYIVSDSHDEILEKIFDGNVNLLDTLSLVDIENKIKYVKKKYNIFSNDLLKMKKAKYDVDDRKYKKTKVLQSEVNKIKVKYNACITEYQKDIIKDIEILFHIYSGRIVQDRNGGNGLFITTKNGIKFVEHPRNSFDALFKLSSGQLAALMISFTLALNKKYSLDNLLLIDDPVQTLDELNIAAFIEVLRNDFSDRQIFISTHEDIMSAFMRYKFEKYGLKTERISMSKFQLEVQAIN